MLCLSAQTQAGMPRVLKSADIKAYQDIFKAQKSNQFQKAQAAEKKISNPLLMGYVLFDRYFAKKYKTSQNEIARWMEKYSDLPVAVDMYALGTQKKVSQLKKPKGLFGSNTEACSSPSRREPIDLISSLNFVW